MIVVLSLSWVLGAWLYDQGRRIAGYHNDESAREIQSLRNHVMELDSELTKLRSLAGSGESSLQIERSAQKQLTRQVKILEMENAALKQDLAFFEGLMPVPGASDDIGLRIDRIRVEPDVAPGGYRYRVLVVNSGGRQLKEVRAELQLAVRVRQNGKDVIIVLPSEGSEDEKYRFEIKHFRRLEGEFSVPSGAVVKSVEAKILQEGAVRARQSLNF